MSQAETELAKALEAYFISGKADKALKSEFAPGVLLSIRHAYAQRIFKPVWTEAGAQNLTVSVRTLFEQGIVADKVFERDLKKVFKKRFKSKSAKKRAKADLELTQAFFRAAQAVSGGLNDEGGVAKATLRGPMRFNLTSALIKAGQGEVQAELAELEPLHPQYKALKSALSEYRNIYAAGGWLAIPEGDAVELGESDARMPALKARLQAEGYMASNNIMATPLARLIAQTTVNAQAVSEKKVPSLEMDSEIHTALKVFQKRHGLEDDGVLGKNTILALNESVESKIDRIADTLTRWRQHGDMGERYIWANTPSYTAEGWNQGQREISMRTVVGKARHATPVFSDTVEYVVANPKWFVPVSITRRQKLPKMRKDATYAESNNYAVFDRATGAEIDPLMVDWSQSDAASQYRFVQGPGEGNAMGEMKIIFPNQYSVYLHGSPSKSLFEKAQRAFSSGCVRLEDPARMAKWIANGDEDFSPLDVKQALDADIREKFVLDERLPVHITYFTVTANEDGSVNFWRDVYSRDDGISYVQKYAKPYTQTADLRR